MRDVTFTDLERVGANAGETERDVPLQMDEDAFKAFYDRNARALWAYVSRVSGDRQLADDLLQETFYRFLRSGASYESDQHRRNALFQIATNLVRDSRRRRLTSPVTVPAGDDGHTGAADTGAEARAGARTDLRRALSHLRQRDRALLWLAYAHGSSHREIAATLGLRPGSIKLMLFRARRRLADRLLGRDVRTASEGGSCG
jgi:RNA polymerase sigma-70 factor (ECF subfamily)